jgi:hypothetical protein
MRTPTDALRSLKKYVAFSLGDEWEVRFAGEEGAFRRPFARVEEASGARYRMTGAMQMEATQPFSILCHIEEREHVDAARLEAARVQGLLVQAFLVGTHAPSRRERTGFAVNSTQARTVSRGHPLRVPLYDYDGIGVDEAATEDDRAPNDFMRVTSDPLIQVIFPDSVEDLRYVVAATVTMSWATSAAVLSDAMTVRNVTATEEGA